MAAPRVGEQLVVQDPLEGPEQDSGQVALIKTSRTKKLTVDDITKKLLLRYYSQADLIWPNSPLMTNLNITYIAHYILL